MKICVEYYQNCTHEHHSGERYGDWSANYDSGIDSVYELLESEQAPYNSETFLIPDGSENAYVVYMIYDDGDSFGCACGKIDIVHCTSSEEAAYALAEKITKNPDSYTIQFTDDFGRDIYINNCGAGYFERIEYVEVSRHSVGNGRSKKRFRVN